MRTENRKNWSIDKTDRKCVTVLSTCAQSVLLRNSSRSSEENVPATIYSEKLEIFEASTDEALKSVHLEPKNSLFLRRTRTSNSMTLCSWEMLKYLLLSTGHVTHAVHSVECVCIVHNVL